MKMNGNALSLILIVITLVLVSEGIYYAIDGSVIAGFIVGIFAGAALTSVGQRILPTSFLACL